MHVQMSFGESAPDRCHVGAPFRAGSRSHVAPGRKAKSILMNATGLDGRPPIPLVARRGPEHRRAGRRDDHRPVVPVSDADSFFSSGTAATSGSVSRSTL